MSKTAVMTNTQTVQIVWSGLKNPWCELPHEEVPNESIWRKTCPLFDAFVCQVDPHRFHLNITNSNGDIIYNQALSSASPKDAHREADVLIVDFVKMGLEILADEAQSKVNLKVNSLFVENGVIYGVTGEGGVVMKRADCDTWNHISMKVS